MPCFSCFGKKKSKYDENIDDTDAMKKNKKSNKESKSGASRQLKNFNGSTHTNKAFVDENQVSTNKIDDETFRKLFSDLDPDGKQIENLMKLPDDMKLKLIQSRQKTGTLTEDPPEIFIETIKNFISSQNEVSISNTNSTNELYDKCLHCLEELRLALRIRPISFVSTFLEQNGFEVLLEFLNKMSVTMRKSNLHFLVISCIKALMNNTQGRQHVIGHENGINIITQSLYKSNNKVKIIVLEILSAICFLSDDVGHEKAFNAMKYYKNYAKERVRFQSLIKNLDEDYEDCDDFNLKIATMSFINALLCRGCGEKVIEFRLHVRYEFLMLGIQTVVDKIRNYNNKVLDKHLDYFEATRYDDEYNYACLFNETHINAKSATVMFDLICKKLVYSPCYENWLSILHHLLLASIKDKIENTNFWCIIDSIIQQIVLQLVDCRNIDQDTIKIDLNQILIKTSKQNEFNGLKQQISLQETEINDLKSKLNKKEKEFNNFNEEYECLKTNYNKLKLKYEDEIVKSKEFEVKIKSLEENLSKSRNDTVNNRKSDLLLQDNTDDAKMKTKIEQRKKITLSTTEQTNQVVPSTPISPISNFTPNDSINKTSTPSLPPAPPPPPLPKFFGPGGFGLNGPPSPKMNKNIPKSKVPMKCFNWNKIPLNSYDITLWKNVNDESLYNILDLDEFQKTFSAYQKSHENDSLSPTAISIGQNSLNFASLGSQRSLSNNDLSKPNKQARKEFSVIDFTRGRNCTILLSKLKMSNSELKTILLNMDKNDELHKDMIEQLLKFIPTAEEETLLEENRNELANMAKADRFLYEMSKIFRYKQKLEVLYFKKKYLERYKETCFKIETIIKCCQLLKQNKNVVQLLEIVLALGNFMNQSHKKGVAVGFSIANLNKLVDVKSANDRTYSMLHFLINTIQEKFPHLLNLPDELNSLTSVAKMNFENLEIECSSLEIGFDELEKEIEIHLESKAHLEEYEEFRTLASDFHNNHSDEVHELKNNFLEMKKEFSSMMRYFGEDENKTKLEEFFAIWNTFLASFNETKNEIRIKKQRELDEKKIREKQIKDKPSLSNGTLSKQNNGENAEFDNLVSEIFSGNAFNKRNNRRKIITSTSGQHVDSFNRHHRERILSED